MELEQQVSSVPLSKRIKELGVKQDSQFYWSRYIEKGPEQDFQLDRKVEVDNYRYPHETISAFTVAELGEMLPEAFLWEGTTQVGLSSSKYSGGWFVRYLGNKFQGKRLVAHEENDKTEADARAKMLIYLLENKLIEGGR